MPEKNKFSALNSLNISVVLVSMKSNYGMRRLPTGKVRPVCLFIAKFTLNALSSGALHRISVNWDALPRTGGQLCFPNIVYWLTPLFDNQGAQINVEPRRIVFRRAATVT